MKASETILNVIENSSTKFKYQLLSRLKSDCDYYLGYGHRNKNALWSGSEEQQIIDMKALLESFDSPNKPEWLTIIDIWEYEIKMCNKISIKDAKLLIYLGDFKYLKDYIKYRNDNNIEGHTMTDNSVIEYFKQLGITVEWEP